MEQSGGIKMAIPFDNLSFKDWVALSWALSWRGLLIMIASRFTAGLIGGMIGFAIGWICVAAE